MHWPRLGNKGTGQGAAPGRGDLGVVAWCCLPWASSRALLEGGRLCYRQSVASRSLEATVSLCATPEPTCGRVSSFRPPSTRVFKLEGIQRAADVWGLITPKRLREPGKSWLESTDEGGLLHSPNASEEVLRRRQTPQRWATDKRQELQAVPGKIVTDIMKLITKKSQALEHAAERLWNLPSLEISEFESRSRAT